MSFDNGADMTAGLAVPEGICDHYTNTAATLSITVYMYPTTLGLFAVFEAILPCSSMGEVQRRTVEALPLQEKDTNGGELWSAPCMLDCKVYH